MKRLAVAVLLGLALVACGGTGEHTSAGAASGSGGGGASSASAGSGGSANAGTGGSSAACPAGHICFEVKAVDTTTPIEAGRIAAVWFQINDDGPDPRPLVAYEAPFDPAVSRVNIPIADIIAPGPELLFCDRACNDESMCPCLADPQIGFGAVVVSQDANQDGMLDATEALAYYGMGWMSLGYSDKPYMPAPPPILDVKFPEGIERGIRPYRIIDEMGTFDNLGLSQDGDIFDLNVCPTPGSTCSLPQPNLT
jgi:hypothetical protein